MVGLAGSFGDQLVEVVGLAGGQFPHAEVVEHEKGWPGELAQPAGPGVVGVPVRRGGPTLGWP
jgi:hypothetical protein